MRFRFGAAVAIILFAASACSTTEVRQEGRSSDATRLARPLRLAPVVSADEPIALLVQPRERTTYLAERGGTVRLLRDDSLGAPVLDISDAVNANGERGLLGATFSPDGTWLYVHYSNLNGDTRVVAYPFVEGRAQRSAGREILAVAQPFPNHNGGALLFGRDGKLYLGLGDGGSQGDPSGNGQRLDTLLGKILRIEPTPTGARPYEVPADNPFVRTPGARGEVWTYGLRNPWRFSFDRANGDLWVGDVGQNAIEEIDWRSAADAPGTNFGWNAFEGSQSYSRTAAVNAVGPTFEYRHGPGCSVTGGYVYRGSAMPEIAGTYFFADVCEGKVRALVRSGGVTSEVIGLGLPLEQIVSFGEDAAGEIYALSLGGTVARIAPVS